MIIYLWGSESKHYEKLTREIGVIGIISRLKKL